MYDVDDKLHEQMVQRLKLELRMVCDDVDEYEKQEDLHSVKASEEIRDAIKRVLHFYGERDA